MIKFMICFGQPDEADSFENVFQDFLALVERMPDIQRRQVVHVTGSPRGAPPFYRILELYFESAEKQRSALMSAAGQEAGSELNKLKSELTLLFADVYEEAGGSTPSPAPVDSERPDADAADEKAEADSPRA